MKENFNLPPTEGGSTRRVMDREEERQKEEEINKKGRIKTLMTENPGMTEKEAEAIILGMDEKAALKEVEQYLTPEEKERRRKEGNQES